MANRDYISQNLHDRVLSFAASHLHEEWKVYTNPGQEKNAWIGNSYPDIILTNKQTNFIEFIIEVETEDSITAHEAYGQWKNYANLSGTFYLMVPQHARQKAEFLCKEYGVQAKFATYWLDSNGKISLNYES